MSKAQEILAKVEGTAERFEMARKGLLKELAEVAAGEKQATHWLHWNALKLVNVEKAAEEWARLAECVRKRVEAGDSDEDILKYLQGAREGLIERILSWPGSRSTSQMANLIDDEERAVLQEVVGRNIMDMNSLTEMLG